MAAGGVKNWKEFEDLEESDFLPEGYYCGEAHLGNFDNEHDVAKYYKSLYNVALGGNRRNRKVPHPSKFVQTDPDTSGVPPSWIIAGQSMVNELYTGLGNIINTLYHSPNINGANTQQKDSNELQLSKTNMKYFRYENGYYISKLMPNIKFPADVKVDDNREILSSAHMKKKFKELLEVATKLRNSVPYIYEDLNTLKCVGGDSEIQPRVMLSKSQQTEDSSKPCLCKFFSNLNASNQSNFPGVLSKPGYSMNGDNKNIKTRSVDFTDKRNENTDQQQMADTTSLPINEDNGIMVTKCKIHRHVIRSGRNVKNTAKKIPSTMNVLAKNTSKDCFSVNDCGLIIVRGKTDNLNSDNKSESTAETCSSSDTSRSNLARLNKMKNTGARAKVCKTPNDKLKFNSKESKMNLVLAREASHVKPEAVTSEAGNKNFILRNIKAAKNARATFRANSNKVRD